MLNDAERTPSVVEQRILDAVDGDNLTWLYGYRLGNTTTRWRLWLTETVYRTLTTAEKNALHRLMKRGVVRRVTGWHSGIGGVERVQPKVTT